MKELNDRQLIIQQFIRLNPGTKRKFVLSHVNNSLDKKFSTPTIGRDIDDLLKRGLIQRQGLGGHVIYIETPRSALLKEINVEDYFSRDLDAREIVYKKFNFEIFRELKGLFTKEESKKLNKLSHTYQERVKKLSPTIVKKEIERLVIDFCWKSSQIEGNTYSLIDAEILIKRNQEAKGHTKDEATMILNHKKAFNFVYDKQHDFKSIFIKDIENLHSLLIDDLGITKGFRSSLVGITGTRYKPLDNQYQIREAVEEMIKIINAGNDPLEQSLIAALMIAYIQPFEDGNKRTSRLLSNAILIANNFCPLSYRSIEEGNYKKAMLLFYETNNISLFKELFVQQFIFSVDNYFL